MRIIIGNPPYNAKSKNNYDIDEYKKINGEKLDEKNWVSLNDDYVKFIRFAQLEIDKVDKGVAGIVVNNGFLDNITFRGMRHSLMKTFDKIYIVNLHGNAKKKERAPDGGKDENIFNILMGVCIAIFVKSKDLKFEKNVFYKDIYGNKNLKCEWLENNAFENIDFIELEPFEPNNFFVPFSKDENYETFYEIKQIFRESNSGIKTNKDKLVIDFDKEILLKRMRDFSMLTENEAREKYRLGKDGRDWKVNFALKDLKKHGIKEDFLKKVVYRPFDERYIYYRDNMKEGMVARHRYSIMQHMLKGENVGLIFQRKLISGIKFPTLSKCICDINCLQGGACLAPLYLYKALLNDDEKIENFVLAFRKFIDEKYDHRYSPEEILGYIYGVLYSDFYQTKYTDYLRCDFARIPFTSDKGLFESLSEKGWELIELHLMKTIPNENGGEYKSEGNNVITKVFFENDRVYINHNSYFDRIPEEVWNFDIGSYHVIPHYLKARKNRVLASHEITHVENVIKILKASVTQMKKIDDVYKEIDKEWSEK